MDFHHFTNRPIEIPDFRRFYIFQKSKEQKPLPSPGSLSLPNKQECSSLTTKSLITRCDPENLFRFAFLLTFILGGSVNRLRGRGSARRLAPSLPATRKFPSERPIIDGLGCEDVRPFSLFFEICCFRNKRFFFSDVP